MRNTIVFIFFAIMFYLLHRLIRKELANDQFKSSIRNAVIDKVTSTENNNTRYYVTFETEYGEVTNGKSIAYAVTHKKYKAGDEIQIKYFIIKNGKARVKVLDDELIPCSDSAKSAAKFCLFSSVIFGALGIANLFFFM